MQIKKIPLHTLHESLGAKMVPFAGYYMPVRYTSEIEEHHTVRNAVGIFDVSHMGEFIVSGAAALSLLQKITTNDVSLLTVGKAQYSCLPNNEGGIIDDLIIYRIADKEYMLVVNAANIEKDWNWISYQNTILGAELVNVSDETCLFAVQGPKTIACMQKLTENDLTKIPYYSFVKTTFAGVPDVYLSNTGYTGSGGFEIFVHNTKALQVWQAIIEAGATVGIKPIGLGARDTLRLEMGYCLYGNDIDDTTSPIEAGLGWITKFTKNFVSYDLFSTQKKMGVSKKLCGFIMTERGIPRRHYKILNAQSEIIGEVTSGTLSPSLGKAIGMGYIQTAYAETGSEIYVLVRNMPVKAIIVKPPFYKP